jgi:hypothetical protein
MADGKRLMAIQRAKKSADTKNLPVSKNLGGLSE